MDQKSDMIREDIDETRTQLTEKLGVLEGQLRGTVETAKSTVEDTIENVRANLRKFTPSYQVEEHPLICLGGAVAAGVLAGRAIGAPGGAPGAEPTWGASEVGYREMDVPATSEYEDVSAPRESYERAHSGSATQRYGEPRAPSRAAIGPTLWDKFQDTFSDEIDMVKHMAMGALLSSLRDLAKRSAPNIGPQIDQVMDSAMNKFGVTPDNLAQSGPNAHEEWQPRSAPKQDETLASKVV